MKKALIASIVLGAATAAGHASITLQPQLLGISSDANSAVSGGTSLPANSLVVWVADVDDDGIGGALGFNQILPDPDDVIMAITDSRNAAGFITGPVNVLSVTNNLTDGNGDPVSSIEGLKFGAIWFDVPFDNQVDYLTQGAGPLVNYGLTLIEDGLATTPQGAPLNVRVPLEGTGVAFDMKLQAASGLVPNDDARFTSPFTTSDIPEPSSALLTLACGGLLFGRRRRNA